MSAPPFQKISAPLSTLLAAIGLAAVAALTTPDLTERTRSNLEFLLVGIWVAYLLQLAWTTLVVRSVVDFRPPGVIPTCRDSTGKLFHSKQIGLGTWCSRASKTPSGTWDPRVSYRFPLIIHHIRP